MIDWLDICLLMLSCVLMNHMGLISAFEEVIRHEIPIISCVKCSTFWSVLILCLFKNTDVITSITISFLLSYVAIWLELFFGFIDSCYEKFYNEIYKESAIPEKTNTDNTDASHSENTLS